MTDQNKAPALTLAMVPDTLNGLPICAVQLHRTTATVMVVCDPQNSPNPSAFCVALWSPDLGDRWISGDYHDGAGAEDRAMQAFHATAKTHAFLDGMRSRTERVYYNAPEADPLAHLDRHAAEQRRAHGDAVIAALDQLARWDETDQTPGEYRG